jgi:hypothetical protein
MFIKIKVHPFERFFYIVTAGIFLFMTGYLIVSGFNSTVHILEMAYAFINENSPVIPFYYVISLACFVGFVLVCFLMIVGISIGSAMTFFIGTFACGYKYKPSPDDGQQELDFKKGYNNEQPQG